METAPSESASIDQLHSEFTAVAQRERIVAIDVLRGFALLGILLMNIQSFSMIGAAYVNPMAYGDMTGANYGVWLFCHIFADQKFMSIFSMLFGVGIVLMTHRQEQRGRRSARLHYRRMGILLVFGLLHAYLLWYGDILVAYALCGMVAFLFHRLPWWVLVFLGVCAIAAHSAINAGLSTVIQHSPEAIEAMHRDMFPPADDVAKELATYRGGWLGQMPSRAKTAAAFETLIFLLWTAWRSGGLMLVGMALFKLKLFDASRAAWIYWLMLVGGMCVGVPMIAFGHKSILDHNWEPVYSMFAGSEFNYWGSLFVAFAYIGLVMLACRTKRLNRLTRCLAAVGQMAFTNYLLQSIICTTIFYGHGFGYFGRLERVEQLAIVLAVWVLQLLISLVWLRYFLYGPAEWLWRSLTYRTWPPMIRTHHPI